MDDTPFEEMMRVEKITNCSCTTCPGFTRSEPPVENDNIEEENLVSDLLDRAVPSSEDEPFAGSRHNPSLPSLQSLSTNTPPTPDLLLTTMTSATEASASTTTPISGSNSLLGGLLSSGENDALDEEDLYSLVDLPSFEDRGLPLFLGGEDNTFESEQDHNAIDENVDKSSSSEMSYGLEHTMKNLNELLRGKGALEYRKLSLNEIKSAINNFDRQPRPLSNQVVNSAPLEAEKNNK